MLQSITRHRNLTYIRQLSEVRPQIHAVLTSLDCFMIVKQVKSNSWTAYAMLVTGCVLQIKKQIICVAQATKLSCDHEISLLFTIYRFNSIVKCSYFLTAFIKWSNLKS